MDLVDGNPIKVINSSQLILVEKLESIKHVLLSSNKETIVDSIVTARLISMEALFYLYQFVSWFGKGDLKPELQSGFDKVLKKELKTLNKTKEYKRFKEIYEWLIKTIENFEKDFKPIIDRERLNFIKGKEQEIEDSMSRYVG